MCAIKIKVLLNVNLCPRSEKQHAELEMYILKCYTRCLFRAKQGTDRYILKSKVLDFYMYLFYISSREKYFIAIKVGETASNKDIEIYFIDSFIYTFIEIYIYVYLMYLP